MSELPEILIRSRFTCVLGASSMGETVGNDLMRKILIVDDEKIICTAIKGALNDEGYTVKYCLSGRKAMEIIKRDSPDLILLDIWLPDLSGIEVLKQVKIEYPDLPIIIMSGHGTIETAVKATKLGAYEFIEKPISLDKLILCIQNALKLVSLKEENKALKKRIITKPTEIIGNSSKICELREQVNVVAPTDSSILITGENGTGKEIVATMIHQKSERFKGGFVPVNCAAIPEDLIESELFGYEKGAFTGADSKKKGKFDLAHKGTIFLDEIGDMSLKTQAKILRIIQEKRFERVGGAKTIEVDVRIIAATNKNLHSEIEKGNFREDLFYRLNVIPFHLPPLRERKKDIPAFIDYFIQQYAYNHQKPKKVISDQAINILICYQWPGNVRELKNMIERLYIMSKNSIIMPSDIPANLRDFSISFRVENEKKALSMKEAKNQFEKKFILEKLDLFDWNISKTAEAIGVERSNLHRKIKQFEIDTKILKN